MGSILPRTNIHHQIVAPIKVIQQPVLLDTVIINRHNIASDDAVVMRATVCHPECFPGLGSRPKPGCSLLEADRRSLLEIGTTLRPISKQPISPDIPILPEHVVKYFVLRVDAKVGGVAHQALLSPSVLWP